MTILNKNNLAQRLSESLSDLNQNDALRGERFADAFASWFITIANPPITNRIKSVYKTPILPILSVKIVSTSQFESIIQLSLDTMAKLILTDPAVLAAASTGVTVKLPTRNISLQEAMSIGMRNEGNVVDDVCFEIASQAVSWARSGDVVPAGSTEGAPWA